MSMDDNDGQMTSGDLGGLKLPDICLTGEEKPRKNLTQETCSDRGSNPGPQRDKRASYHLLHSGGLNGKYQLLLYADEINMLGENLQTFRENTEIFIKASKDIGLEVNSDKTKYMITCRQQNIVQNQK